MSLFTKIRNVVEAVTVAPLAPVAVLAPGVKLPIAKGAVPLVQAIGAAEIVAAPFVLGAIGGPAAFSATSAGIGLLQSRAAGPASLPADFGVGADQREQQFGTPAKAPVAPGAPSSLPLIAALAAGAGVIALL